MVIDARLVEVLLEADEQLERGRAVAVEQLCPESPELLAGPTRAGRWAGTRGPADVPGRRVPGVHEAAARQRINRGCVRCRPLA